MDPIAHSEEVGEAHPPSPNPTPALLITCVPTQSKQPDMVTAQGEASSMGKIWPQALHQNSTLIPAIAHDLLGLKTKAF